MQGQAGRNTRACGRAINLGIGKDADVTAMMSRVLGWACQNGTIKKTQIGFKWMRNHHCCIDSYLDSLSSHHKFCRLFGSRVQSNLAGGENSVKCAAEGYIDGHVPYRRHIDFHVLGKKK